MLAAPTPPFLTTVGKLSAVKIYITYGTINNFYKTWITKWNEMKNHPVWGCDTALSNSSECDQDPIPIYPAKAFVCFKFYNHKKLLFPYLVCLEEGRRQSWTVLQPTCIHTGQPFFQTFADWSKWKCRQALKWKTKYFMKISVLYCWIIKLKNTPSTAPAIVKFK